MKAMILAAGRGERMRPLTDDTPKPLLKAGGRPLLDYHLDALARSGITDAVVNGAWLREQIRAYLHARQAGGLRLSFSDEGPAALETGGGIFRALPLLGDEPFWVVNGDVYLEYEFATAMPDAASDAHLLLTANPAHNRAGDFALDGGRVSNHGSQMLTYTGVAILRPGLFAGCSDGAFPLAPLLRRAADAGRVSGEVLRGYWCDVGTPARLAALDSRLNASAGGVRPS